MVLSTIRSIKTAHCGGRAPLSAPQPIPVGEAQEVNVFLDERGSSYCGGGGPGQATVSSEERPDVDM